MKAKVILCPVDFSPMTQHALELGSSLAIESGAKLTILHVERTPVSFDGEMHREMSDDLIQLKESLHRVLPTEPGVRFKHRFLFGDPAEVILKTADTENADLIIMGTHGRTGLSRFVMGSVAEQVVRRASCPVLTIRQPAEAKVMSLCSH
jgi:nucleotide-binding universal stress UspA family protein